MPSGNKNSSHDKSRCVPETMDNSWIVEFLFGTIKPTDQNRKPGPLEQTGKAMKIDPQSQMKIL